MMIIVVYDTTVETIMIMVIKIDNHMYWKEFFKKARIPKASVSLHLKLHCGLCTTVTKIIKIPRFLNIKIYVILSYPTFDCCLFLTGSASYPSAICRFFLGKYCYFTFLCIENFLNLPSIQSSLLGFST